MIPVAPKSKSKKTDAKAGTAKAQKGPRKGKKEADDSSAEDSATHKKLESVLQEMTAQPEKTHIESTFSLQCPYCGEVFEIHVTSEEDGQTMTEDCHVCCRPISVHVTVEDDEIQVSAFRS